MKVLVVPEDPKLDQHILKPIAEKLFEDLGRRARVTVLANPRLRGVAQALDAAKLAEIVSRYPMVNLFLVMVDRDGDTTRQGVAAARESEHPGCLFACLAIEEIEIWMLAIHPNALGSWSEIRQEPNVKEKLAQPFLVAHAPKLDPGRGRAWAMRGLGGVWRGVLERCPELKELKEKIGSRLTTFSS